MLSNNVSKPTFTYLNKPIKISEQSWDPDIQPVVSISCVTYNHEEFLNEAIKGFLMQETTFPVEILIHDDASTDRTHEIIRKYEIQYPNLFKVIYQKENQYSKKVLIGPAFQYPRVRGKYYACCEGDDYWTDPLKLQKQVAFLENNMDYSFVCGGYIARDTLNKQEDIIIDQKISGLEDDDNGFEITFQRIKNDWITKTLTLLFRIDCLNLDVLSSYRYQRDVHIIYYLMKAGKGYYIKDIFGVYNIHSNGVHSKVDNLIRRKTRYLLYQELYEKDPSNYLKYKLFQSVLHILTFKLKDKNYNFPKTRLSLIKQALKLASNKGEYIRIIETLIPKLKPVLRKLY